MSKDYVSALNDAAAAFSAGLSRADKLAILSALKESVEANLELYIGHIVREAKKPRALARAEAGRALGNIDEALHFLSKPQDRLVELSPSLTRESRKGVWRAFARGVVVGITPYNFPLNLVLHKVLPAICAGAPIIIKPDPRTPSAAFELEKALLAAGLPKGFVQVLELSVAETEAMCSDERVEVISFTGSEKVGWHLKRLFPSKHVVLELGGTATAIYAKPTLESEDVMALSRAALAYSGQVCISTQNVLVLAPMMETAKELFEEHLSGLKRGTPDRDDTLYGPLIDERHRQRMIELFARSVEEGAEVLALGEDEGDNLAARLVILPHDQFEIAREEIFGPALVLIPYQDQTDAERIFAELKSTLQAAVFTDDDALWETYQNRLRTGALLRNHPPTFRQDGMPYGGVKTSGIGREGVAYAFEEFSERRLLIA